MGTKFIRIADSEFLYDAQPVIETLMSADDIMPDTVLVFDYKEWTFLYKILVSIRLSLPFIGSKALNPIAISGGGNLADLLSNPMPYIEILLTPEVKVVEHPDEIETRGMKAITINDYCKKFLPHIKVCSEQGSHSIANEWAAFNIDRLLHPHKAGMPKTSDFTYLCYLLTSGMTEEDLKKTLTPPESRDKSGIKRLKINRQCKMLLIDDQDDYWAGVVRDLLCLPQTADPNQGLSLDVWGKDSLDITVSAGHAARVGIKGIADYRKKILDEYDLVLLDMRLAGSSEQHQDTDRLSGIVMLRHLLDEEDGGNPGQRVIVFTSSNKSWNIKRSLQIGAQDIFIKESPTYPLKESERIENLNNLITEIAKGLSTSWLKDIHRMAHKIIKVCDDRIDQCGQEEEHLKDFYDNIADQVTIACSLFLESDKTDQEKMRLSYVSLETVFEIIGREWLVHNNQEETTKPINDRVQELIKDYDIIDRSSPYIENATRVLIQIRNKAIHPEGGKPWHLPGKCPWRLSDNTDDNREYITRNDYATSFRALMYLLHMIFVKRKDLCVRIKDIIEDERHA